MSEYNNQNEPHYYRPQDEESNRQTAPRTEERGATRHHQEGGDHDDDGEACMHPMHMAVCFFSFLAVVFCAIALGTPSSYVVSTNTTTSYGIFRQCVDSQCGGIQYTDFNSTQCEIRKASSWQTRQLMSQLAIIFGCVFSLAAVGLSFTGKKPGMTSILLIVMTALAFVCILLGVLRLIYTYEIWLYCDMNFCKLARSDSSITNANLPSSGCEAGYGYSFALLVISTGGMFFSMIFAIMRMAFKDWYLRKVLDHGDEPAAQQPVYAAQPHDDQQQPETRQAPAQQEQEMEQQEDGGAAPYQQGGDQSGEQQWEEPRKSPARSPGSKTPPPKRSPGSRSPGKSPARSPRQRSPARGPAAKNRTPQRSPRRTPQAATPVQQDPEYQQRGVSQAADDDMPPGDWVFDEEAGLYWSAEEYLYMDPNTKHYFDPNSEKWYNPDTQEWYDGVPHE